MTNSEKESLQKRVIELCSDCTRRSFPRFFGFLTPEEQAEARLTASSYPDVFLLAFGVFEEAERVVLGFFPSDVYLRPEEGGDMDQYREWAQVKAVEIKGSGYRSFSHRDILGTMMSLGVKRETVGDIRLTDDAHTAYAAVSESVADYLAAAMERVANDRVHTSVIEEKRLPKFEQRFEDLSVTLSSVRIDALVAEIAKCSRDKAKGLISAGKVSLNHTPVLSCDKAFAEGDTVTVAGTGKFRVDAFLGLTAKERTRVVVRKYV